MLAERLIPWLVERFDLHEAIYTRTLHTVGVGESELDRRIEDLFRTLENPKIAMLAHGFRVDVKVMAKASSRAQAEAMIAPVVEELRRRIGAAYYGEDGVTLPGAIVGRLRERGWTLGTAESCTGGAVADAIVTVPGASATFRGGIVAYANDVKTGFLDVPPETLARFGAVSEETAVAMATGARSRRWPSRSCSSSATAISCGLPRRWSPPRSRSSARRRAPVPTAGRRRSRSAWSGSRWPARTVPSRRDG